MLDNILAGPILRRTTKNRICVWLALDCKHNLSLEILDLHKIVVGRSKPDELEACRFQLGNHLYVYLLQAYSDSQGYFPTNTLFYYRLLDDHGMPLDLKSAGLTYGRHEYPVFHIPDKLQSVLHGSCRKPHGAGGDDCLAAGDRILETTHDDVDQRPELLLLTGDQIYADDVDASLLDVIRTQAVNLTGYSETLPLSPPNPTPLIPSAIPLGGRAEILKKHRSGFSSTEADNHLLSFGEFAAMYIYVFGNAKGWQTATSWEAIANSHKPLADMIKWKDYLPSENGLKWRDYLPGSGVNCHDKLIALKQTKLASNIKNVTDFGRKLNNVRRLMANIPTYMIFDDHDVTDDWNISGHWYDQVRSSPLGRRIVSNALAAYWAFQGWGNDPENFDTDMIPAITGFLNNPDHDPEAAEHYDLMTWKHRGWSFSIATDPPIIAMDSRTQRQPDNDFYPPRLLDRYALDWLRVEWSKLKTGNGPAITDNTCPVLIAATPVFGFSPLEHIVRLLLWGISYLENIKMVSWLEDLLHKKGIGAELLIDLLDAEAWTANLDGFTAFMDTLLNKIGINQCLFLSGDVHYSFTSKGTYTSKSSFTGTNQTLNCYQLTSSSLRNEPSDAQKNALDALEKFTAKTNLWHRFKRRIRPLQMLLHWQWHSEHDLVHPNTGGKCIIEACNLGQVKFDKGLPIKHSLLHDPNNLNNSVDYDI